MFHLKLKPYLENAPLWDQDDSWQGFQWLCADDNNANTVAFLRWDRKGTPLLVLCNFSLHFGVHLSLFGCAAASIENWGRRAPKVPGRTAPSPRRGRKKAG